MNREELQAIVESVGRGEVSRSVGWSRWTMGRKLSGRSQITKAEHLVLQALAITRRAADE